MGFLYKLYRKDFSRKKLGGCFVNSGLEAPRNSLELDSSLSSTNLVAIEEDFQVN